MAITADFSHPLAELVSYLFTRREANLANWRTMCEQDPILSKVSALSREEFDNLLPITLGILEQRLLSQPEEADPVLTAHNHGLHRWHKAHSLPETLQELHHLTYILNQEIIIFQALFPQTDAGLLVRAQSQITQLMSQTIMGSVDKYDELQRFDAVSRLATLQQALEQMEEVSQQRGEILRSSSHDLRGSFGIINTAAFLLKQEDLDEEQRATYLEMLNRNLGQVQSLLTSLIDLSRLESGVESLNIQRVDAARLLQEMVNSAQLMAQHQGLKLQSNGPATLEVDTDPIKLQRIAQNLLLNALKYTKTGFISVSWAREGPYRWLFSVQDSGSGLPRATIEGLLGEQLKPTVEPTSVLSPEDAEPVAVYPHPDPEVPTGNELNQLVSRSSRGEGVGLQIVKRLCEMLNAQLDIESLPERGTMFRVRMPTHPHA